jgi:hypothetical protein
MADSSLTEVDLNLDTEYYRKGELFLKGGLNGGKYAVKDGTVTGKGYLQLLGKLGFTAGDTTITVGLAAASTSTCRTTSSRSSSSPTSRWASIPS